MWEIVSLGFLALVLGFVYNFIQPKLAAVVPSTYPQGRIAQSFLTGAFIMVAFLLANFALQIVGVGKKVGR